MLYLSNHFKNSEETLKCLLESVANEHEYQVDQVNEINDTCYSKPSRYSLIVISTIGLHDFPPKHQQQRQNVDQVNRRRVVVVVVDPTQKLLPARQPARPLAHEFLFLLADLEQHVQDVESLVEPLSLDAADVVSVHDADDVVETDLICTRRACVL